MALFAEGVDIFLKTEIGLLALLVALETLGLVLNLSLLFESRDLILFRAALDGGFVVVVLLVELLGVMLVTMAISF